MTTAEETVRRMVELDEATLELTRSSARAKVQHVADALGNDVPGVPKAVAARVLGLSVPTVEKWLTAGRLHLVDQPESKRELIDARHLSRVAALVRSLRLAGRRRAVVAAVIDRLSQEDPGLQQSLSDMLGPSLAAVEAGNLAELEIPSTFGPED